MFKCISELIVKIFQSIVKYIILRHVFSSMYKVLAI